METFIIAAIIGVIIGIFSGLLGIGGGTLMVPIFRLGFGMSAISSTATSLFTIIPTSLAGLITHVKNKTCIPKWVFYAVWEELARVLSVCILPPFLLRGRLCLPQLPSSGIRRIPCSVKQFACRKLHLKVNRQ